MSACFIRFVFLVLACRLAVCQIDLGPGRCLVNRIDVVPCTFLNPRTTRVPGPNEYGVYTTRIRTAGGTGIISCRIRRRKHRIYPIDSQGIENEVKILYSPGLTLNNNYGNQQYASYDIQCPEGRLAFFNMTSVNMEPPNCFDSRRGEMRCRDYVRVLRGNFGATESCGNDTSSNMNQLDFGSLKVTFRTSISGRFSGFRASVICFDPGQRDLPGCTRPVGEATESPETTQPPDDENTRKRRDLEMFHNERRQRAEHIKRLRRQAEGGNNPELRLQEINVPHGINVTFSNKKLNFINIRANRTSVDFESIEDILFLHTFDANGEVDDFREEAVTEKGILIPLPGPGPMFIVGRHAYFQLFVIDPRGLVPNAEEMVVLANLTEAQENLARENETQRLDSDFLEPPTPTFPPGFGRKKRQAQRPPTFDEQVVLVALDNENACNPVLRSSARSIIEEFGRTNPDDLERLRKSRVTTVTPAPNDVTTPVIPM